MAYFNKDLSKDLEYLLRYLNRNHPDWEHIVFYHKDKLCILDFCLAPNQERFDKALKEKYPEVKHISETITITKWHDGDVYPYTFSFRDWKGEFIPLEKKLYDKLISLNIKVI